ncbi:DoxX family membrane protein [Archangium gephyra]|uniref:DoxX family membrane protein n=1 Tax=Archangium gephyra TaxID=48 RepID=UPI0035D524A7
MLAGYFFSFILAAVLVVFCARWPHTLGRLLLGWIFLVAGAVNLTLALVNPLVYVEGFGPTAIPLYQEFIEGPFALNPSLFVMPIALGQVLCGLGVLFGQSTGVRWGAVGCLVFLVALTGLGVGCAFPANLAMAIGPALMLRHRFLHGPLHGLHRKHQPGSGFPAGR